MLVIKQGPKVAFLKNCPKAIRSLSNTGEHTMKLGVPNLRTWNNTQMMVSKAMLLRNSVTR